MTTTTFQVGSGNDDGREPGSGTPILNDADEIIMANNSPSVWAAMRFTGVSVPQGSTINSATLEINIVSTSYDDPDVDAYLHDVDNSAALSTTTNDLSGRALTTEKVTWTATGVGTGWKSPGSLAAVVQEVVNRAGWASGNAMTVLLDSRSNANNIRFRPYEYSNGSVAAKLTIDYTAPVSGERGAIWQMPGLLAVSAGGAGLQQVRI